MISFPIVLVQNGYLLGPARIYQNSQSEGTDTEPESDFRGGTRTVIHFWSESNRPIVMDYISAARLFAAQA